MLGIEFVVWDFFWEVEILNEKSRKNGAHTKCIVLRFFSLKRESKETHEKRKEKTDSCIHLSLGNQEILVFSGKF